jgi:hypothetical protein
MMAEIFRPGEFIIIMPQGGIPVSLVRYGGTYVRVSHSGGKPGTFSKYEGEPITMDREVDLTEELEEIMGY